MAVGDGRSAELARRRPDRPLLFTHTHGSDVGAGLGSLHNDEKQASLLLSLNAQRFATLYCFTLLCIALDIPLCPRET